jgi:hypothetical protein
VECLTGLFQNLPNQMEPADIANIVAKWGLVFQSISTAHNEYLTIKLISLNNDLD